MIRFERTKDWYLIRKVITDPKIYPCVSDDGSPAPEAFRPIQNDAIWYVSVWDIAGAVEGCAPGAQDISGVMLCGLFMFVPQNAATFEIHTCLLPSCWGAKATQIAHDLHEWAWNNMPCHRIVTNVPAYNRLALRFARKAGMREFGVNQKSYLKDGKLYDQIMLGASREGN